VEENRVLKEQTKRRRLRLTDDQRRRLAVKQNGHAFDRKIITRDVDADPSRRIRATPSRSSLRS
jgi:hypothetical protein